MAQERMKLMILLVLVTIVSVSQAKFSKAKDRKKWLGNKIGIKVTEVVKYQTPYDLCLIFNDLSPGADHFDLKITTTPTGILAPINLRLSSLTKETCYNIKFNVLTDQPGLTEFHLNVTVDLEDQKSYNNSKVIRLNKTHLKKLNKSNSKGNGTGPWARRWQQKQDKVVNWENIGALIDKLIHDGPLHVPKIPVKKQGLKKIYEAPTGLSLTGPGSIFDYATKLISGDAINPEDFPKFLPKLKKEQPKVSNHWNPFLRNGILGLRTKSEKDSVLNKIDSPAIGNIPLKSKNEEHPIAEASPFSKKFDLLNLNAKPDELRESWLNKVKELVTTAIPFNNTATTQAIEVTTVKPVESTTIKPIETTTTKLVEVTSAESTTLKPVETTTAPVPGIVLTDLSASIIKPTPKETIQI